MSKWAEIILSDVKTLEEFKALSGQEKIIRKMARDAANYHHERWDGQGYPEGFKMEEIPVIARICSICFAFETLTSNAGKQVAISKEEAAQQIKGESGKAFDPVLVDVFADTVSEMSIKGDCLISYEKRRADEKNQSRANKKKTSTYFDYKKTKDKLRAVEMWYQPIVDTQTNKIKYYESLMRMNDRYYGVVNPALFIPVAEKTGQICELTEIALEQILETIILSDEKKLSFDRIALNISAKHLTRKTFFSKTEKMIKHSGVSPDRLIFEITESVMATADENLLSTIAALQNIGIKIAIDDFGTEYSSLYRLNKIDVDILKIDKSFIDTMTESAKTRGVIKGIIDMAQNLDIEVVSEGVETQNQREILESLGCYVMQGYLYSKPKTLSQIIG